MSIRERLLKSTSGRTKKEVISIVTNMILGEIDTVLHGYWFHLSDAGMDVKTFKEIKREVKRRL